MPPGWNASGSRAHDEEWFPGPLRPSAPSRTLAVALGLAAGLSALGGGAVLVASQGRARPHRDRAREVPRHEPPGHASGAGPDVVAVAVDAHLDTATLASTCSRSTSRRRGGRSPDAVALASTCSRCSRSTWWRSWARRRGRPGGRSPQRGGAHLDVLAINVVAELGPMS